MSIRPIDLQAIIPKSYEINRINSFDAAKAEMFKKQFKEKIEQDENDLKETISDTEKNSQLVDKDGKNNNKYYSNNKNNKRKKDTQKPKTSLSMFDRSV